jgi:hypothetical protein
MIKSYELLIISDLITEKKKSKPAFFVNSFKEEFTFSTEDLPSNAQLRQLLVLQIYRKRNIFYMDTSQEITG